MPPNQMNNIFVNRHQEMAELRSALDHAVSGWGCAWEAIGARNHPGVSFPKPWPSYPGSPEEHSTTFSSQFSTKRHSAIHRSECLVWRLGIDDFRACSFFPSSMNGFVGRQ